MRMEALIFGKGGWSSKLGSGEKDTVGSIGVNSEGSTKGDFVEGWNLGGLKV